MLSTYDIAGGEGGLRTLLGRLHPDDDDDDEVLELLQKNPNPIECNLINSLRVRESWKIRIKSLSVQYAPTSQPAIWPRMW